MSKFKMPENIGELDADALATFIADAKKEVRELLKDDEPSPENVQLAQEIVDKKVEAETRATELKAESDAREQQLADLRAAAADEEPEESEDAPETDETEIDVEVEVEEPELVEAAVEVEVEETVAEAELEPVTAAAPKSSAVSRAANISTKPEVEVTKSTLAITAAADLSAPEKIEDLDVVSSLAIKRLSSFPKNRLGGDRGTRLRQGIATLDFSTARDDGLFQGNTDFKDDQSLLKEATRETRLDGSSLVAAGGWCAPSETLYGFCREVSTDGILDLPSIRADRGSVRWTKGPDFSAIYANANGDWHLTEAQVIADTQKPIIAVECPAFTETTLDVTGVAVSAGILTQAAYPELVREYIENVLIAHQHKVAGRIYTAIDAASTALSFGAAVASAFDSLGQMEVAIQYMRGAKRMPMGQTMEVLAPYWYKTIIRGDLSRRNGVDLLSVTDQQINAHFALRGANVQWIYNTGQDIGNGAGSDAAGTLSLPATVDLVMYPAGSFVKLTTDLITLDGIYDSTNIKTNTFTALFTEEGYAVVNMCGDAYKVAVSTGMTGRTAAADITAALVGQPTP